MNKKIAIFFPQNPCPSMTGAHKRFIQMISELKKLNPELYLLSNNSNNDWNKTSIKYLKDRFFKEIYIYGYKGRNSINTKFLKSISSLQLKIFNSTAYLIKQIFSSQGKIFRIYITIMQKWFKKVMEKVSPEIIIINYADYSRLLKGLKNKPFIRIIDSLDLISLNKNMQKLLIKKMNLNNIKAGRIKPEILDEDLFKKNDIRVDRQEFKIYDKYDYTIAISKKEEEIIRKNTLKTKTVLIPFIPEPVYLKNTYSGPALFTSGPNIFNTQAYYYFTKRILPLIKEGNNSFCLQITGLFYAGVQPKKEMEIFFTGFIPDLKEIYSKARFLICPVIGGTGQKIKIAEAMAHGIPIISSRQSAESSMIKHGENGFIAKNPKEFAYFVNKLWNDKKLCKKMGECARKTIEKEYKNLEISKKLLLLINKKL